jgi:hypothetical protein
MSARHDFLRKLWLSSRAFLLSAALVTFTACSGGGALISGGGGGGGNVANTVPVVVDLGPAGDFDANILFVTVTVCNPGSSTCVNIDHVSVDTASEGLRIFPQAALLLPQVTDSSGHAVGECTVFADNSFLWGPVVRADVKLAGEKAANIPIQIINSPTFAPVPAGANGCPASVNPSLPSGTEITDNTNGPNGLGANGLLGVGVFRQDCPAVCAQSPPPAMTPYFGCSGNVCNPTSVAVSSLVPNPVFMFPQDNNGMLITLPSVPIGGVPTVTGSMVFGIGTQSNNVLGNSTVLTTNGFGNITTTYLGTPYSASFLDSGSNGIFFLNSATTGLIDCPNPGLAAGLYCPNTTNSFTATNRGQNNANSQVMFDISNAITLLNAGGGTFAAFSDLGGQNSVPSLEFDFGLSFFFGRTVFTGIEGQVTNPGNITGPYNAY